MGGAKGVRVPVAVAARRRRRDGIRLELRIHPELPDAVEGDPARIRQILTNLVGNGIKFTDEGEVVLQARPLELSGDRVRLQLSVTDTGVGGT